MRTTAAAAGAVAALAAAGVAPAVATAAPSSFAGTCSWQGNVHFTPPATTSQQSLTAAYRGTGTCSGTLNGRRISNARVKVRNLVRRVNGSCVHADTTQPGHGAMIFSGGRSVAFSSQFHFVGTNGDFELKGERSGAAHGVGSFLTPRTSPTAAAHCGSDGVADAPLDFTIATDSQLVGGHDRRGHLADFGAALTSRRPGTPSGLRVHILFHRPGDRGAKPSPLRSAVVRGPAGLRFDTATLPRCNATDAQIKLLGTKACPAASELTVGRFSALTGFGPPADPLAGDDHVFNGPGQLIEIITPPGAFLSPAFDRLTIRGSTLTAHPPKAPGAPPDGESSVRSLDFTIPVRTSGRRALIRAPRRCPRSRRWTATGTFGFADGSRDTLRSTTRCVHRRAARR